MLTLRVPEDLGQWLTEISQRTGIPVGQLVREQIERARREDRDRNQRPFLRYAGALRGPKHLSSGKGFSR